MELLSPATPNLVVRLATGSTTTVEVPVPAEDPQVGCVVDGRWRWITATQSRAHPGGAAGDFDLWAVAAANEYVPGAPEVGETDNTFYGFELRIVAVGGPVPGGNLANGKAIAHRRKLRRIVWDGVAITRIAKYAEEFVKLAGAQIDSAALEAGDGLTWTRQVSGALLLNNPRNPTANEKAALAGTDGAPAGGNPYVTDSDDRLLNSWVAGGPSGTAGKFVMNIGGTVYHVIAYQNSD